jgi:hypothetical protein
VIASIVQFTIWQWLRKKQFPESVWKIFFKLVLCS